MSKFISLLPSHIYHIYNHANGSDDLFRESDNYDYFLRRWKKYITPIAETHAYCLMPNHFHTLVRIRSEELLIARMIKSGKATKLEGLQIWKCAKLMKLLIFLRNLRHSLEVLLK